jgi:hypothetical protein
MLTLNLIIIDGVYDAHFYHRSNRIFSTGFVLFLLLYEAVAHRLIESALR